MAPQPQSPPPVPPPVPVETHPNRAGGLKPPLPQRVPPDPTRLAPEHAYAHPQTRLWQDGSSHLRPIDGIVATPASVAALRPPPAVPGTEPRKNDIRRFRDGRRKKRKGVWKKLLWVRQSCMISNFCVSGECVGDTDYIQIRTTTPTSRLSSTIYKETHAFGHTTSGP